MSAEAPAAETARHREDALVRHALDTLRRPARFPLVFGGLAANDGELRITALLGNNTAALQGLRVVAGQGLGGRVLAAQRPAAVGDYYASNAISHDFDGVARAESIRSLVAVPVIVRRSVRAVLYGAVRDAGALGDRAIGDAVTAARDLEQELVVRDEVQRRIADLHAQGSPSLPPRSSAEREALRRGHAELRALCATLTDPGLRERIDAVCAGLTATQAAPCAPQLSPRELDVLACVAIGYSNAETGHALGVKPETAKSHLRSAMWKLDAHSRVQAVNAARALGLLP